MELNQSTKPIMVIEKSSVYALAHTKKIHIK